MGSSWGQLPGESAGDFIAWVARDLAGRVEQMGLRPQLMQIRIVPGREDPASLIADVRLDVGHQVGEARERCGRIWFRHGPEHLARKGITGGMQPDAANDVG